MRNVNLNLMLDVDMMMPGLLDDLRHVDHLFMRHGDGHIDDMLNGTLLTTRLWNHLRHMNHFLMRHGDRHIDDMLNGTLLTTRLWDHLRHFNRALLPTSLWDDFWHLDHLLFRHGNRHVDNMFHRPVHHTLLGDNLGHVNLHLAMVGDVNLNLVLDVDVVVPLLLNNLGDMDDFFLRHRHRDIYDMLDRPVLNPLLRNNFRYMDNLFVRDGNWHIHDVLDSSLLDLLHMSLNSVYNVLRPVHVLHLGDFLDMHNLLDSGNVDDLLLRLAHDVLLLPVGQSDRTMHHLGRLAMAVHWMPHFGNRRSRWAMVRHRCPLGLHMRRRWHVYLPRAARLCATTILRNRGPSVPADRD
jgi:hypothetical protein